MVHSVVCCIAEWVPAPRGSFPVCTLREQGRLAVAVVVVVEAVVEHVG